MDAHNLSLAARYLLSAQFLAGGQARLLPRLTPEISRIPYSSAAGFRDALPMIPSSNALQHLKILGWLLTANGVFLLWPRDENTSRHGLISLLGRAAEGMALVIPGMFAWANYRCGLNMGLPLFNLVLAGVMLWGRGRPEYGITKKD